MGDADPRFASTSRLKSCALLALGPALLLVALVIVFLANNRPPNVHIPTPKMPKDNGRDRILRAEGMTKGQGPVSSTRPQNSWTTAELRQFAMDNQPFLAEVRRGLVKPWMHPPIRTVQQSADVFMSYCTLREVARKLRSMTKYCERVGAYGEAARIHLDAMELGVVFPRGGGVIAGMTGASIQAIGEYGLMPVLARLSPDELAKCARRLEQVQARGVTFSEIVREEGRSKAAMYASVFRGPERISLVANPLDWRDTPWWDIIGNGHGPIGNGALNARHAFSNKTALVLGIMDYCDALAIEQRKPYSGRSAVPLPTEPCARFVVSDVASGRASFERDSAKLTLIQTQVALLRYKLDHGAYPAALSDLVPAHLKKQPIDPFGLGKPLRYKPLNGGKSFLLYSLGPNLKDDGGTPGNWQGASTPGDIVAGRW